MSNRFVNGTLTFLAKFCVPRMTRSLLKKPRSSELREADSVVLFFSGCYGVSDAPSDGQWKCQRCSQEDKMDVEKSVSSISTINSN